MFNLKQFTYLQHNKLTTRNANKIISLAFLITKNYTNKNKYNFERGVTKRLVFEHWE